MKAFVEGFGCSLNQADTEAIKGLLAKNGFAFTSTEKADLIVVNTCAVKTPTENKMVNRLDRLVKEKKKTAKLISFGCLSRINPERVASLSQEIIQVEPALEKLAETLILEAESFQPKNRLARANPWIAILPIARGCQGECSYCCVRRARGRLKSYPLHSLDQAFKQALGEGCKEFWLTAQDCGAYGQEIDSNLPKLLKALLANRGDYRVRMGMMNLEHLKKFRQEMVEAFEDKRLYRFLHLPLQSGSDKVLKEMKRKYSAKEFEENVRWLKKKVKGLTLATDVIVGFPGETERDFRQTVGLLKKLRPDVVNISRYGERPGTPAAEMKGQVAGEVKKERSRELTELCAGLAAEKNAALEGKTLEILVSERGRKGFFQGRTNSYKAVIVKQNLLGKFARVKAVKAFPTYVEARAVKP